MQLPSAGCGCQDYAAPAPIEFDFGPVTFSTDVQQNWESNWDDAIGGLTSLWDKVTGGADDDVEEVAKGIVQGHAWDEHKGEFDVETPDELAEIIEGVIRNAPEQKQLSDGRHGYFDPDSGVIVVRNPADADGGTAFVPNDDPWDYWDGLR